LLEYVELDGTVVDDFTLGVETLGFETDGAGELFAPPPLKLPASANGLNINVAAKSIADILLIMLTFLYYLIHLY
jgi:hypothetical protein